MNISGKMSRLYILFLMLFALLSSTVMAFDTSCSDAGNNLLEEKYFIEITENIASGEEHWYVYEATSADTNISFDFASTNTVDLYYGVGGCGASLTEEKITTLFSTDDTIDLNKGETLMIMVKYRKDADYTLVLYSDFSNSPLVSISPDTKNVGYSATDRNISINAVISECPNREDITVTFTANNGASVVDVILFTKDNCIKSQPFDVLVPGMLAIDSKIIVVPESAPATDKQLFVISTADDGGAELTIVDATSDLSITKTAPERVDVNETFQYVITVENSGGEAYDVTVTDLLPDIYDYDDVTIIADDWNCTSEDDNIKCDYKYSAMADGNISTIILQVDAPTSIQILTNTVEIESENDSNTLNNSDYVITEIIDVNKADDLCFYGSEDLTKTGNTECLNTVGAETNTTLYYGELCDTLTYIGNQNTLKILYEVNVTKIYSDPIDMSTSCGPDADCEKLTTTSDYDPSYGTGYEYHKYLLNPYRSMVITDAGSYSSSGTVNDIRLYATYKRDGELYAGIIPACTGGTFPGGDTEIDVGNIDIIDSTFNSGTYATASIITTKVVEKLTTIDVVFLGDTNSTPIAFDGIAFGIILELAENGGSGPYTNITPLIGTDGRLVVAEMLDGAISATSNAFVMPHASRDAKIVARYDAITGDIAKAIEQCIQRSSTNGNLQDVASCLNSEDKLTEAYVRTASACLNVWVASNGQPYGPCSSNAGNSGFPLLDPFTTEPACLSCLIGPVIVVESKDNFAIRPDYFDLNASTTDSYPDLLRAGREYDVTITANGDDDLPAKGYDQTTGNLVDPPVTEQYFYGNSASGVHLLTNTDASISNATDFTDGKTLSPAQVSYAEVGKITLKIEDPEWASVDINNVQDPSVAGCPDDVTNGASVCSDINMTYIPDHFRVLVSIADSGKGFTYLSNEVNMTADTNITIFAENELNATTTNFREPLGGNVYYENPVAVTITVPNHPDLGAALVNDINATLLGFTLGSRALTQNEANATFRTWFHYDRKTNQPVNPFKLDISNVIVNVDSNYTSIEGATETPQPVVITGTDNDDGNVTYVYGRVHLPRTRTMCGDGVSCTGYPLFYYEIYADKGADKNIINELFTTPQRSVDSVNWYKNTLHNPDGDGNVTGSLSIDNITVTNYSKAGSTTKGTFIYAPGTRGYPYKVTVRVNEPTHTQSWLIYDKYLTDPATQIQGELEYYGPGKWSSDTKAGATKDTTGAKGRNTNRRIRW